MSRNAVTLLSGGLDSTTIFAIAKAEGFDVHALTFSYGQRHSHEINVAKRVAETMGAASHTVIDIDLRQFGGSALTADIPVPKGRRESDMADEIPVTYVPARNTIFLSFALAHFDGNPHTRIDALAFLYEIFETENMDVTVERQHFSFDWIGTY